MSILQTRRKSPIVVYVACVLMLGIGASVPILGLFPILLSLSLLIVYVGFVVVPRSWLPTLALAAFALIPSQELPLPHWAAATAGVGSLVISVWIIRCVVGAVRSRSSLASGLNLTLSGLLLAIWLVVASVASQDRSTSIAWSANFIVIGVLPVVAAPIDPDGVSRLKTAWVSLGAVLGLFAALEAWVLHRNPLFSGPRWIIQQWSTYRATTTLGHPLINGIFFAVALVLVFDRVIQTRSRIWLVAAISCGVGILASQSRGAIVAAVCGCAACLWMRRKSVEAQRRRVFAVFATAVLVGVALLSLSTRNGTREAQTSIAARPQTLAEGLHILDSTQYLGAGPGKADDDIRGVYPVSQVLGIESSWMAFAASDGLPAVLLLIGLVSSCMTQARRRGNVAELGALIAFLVAAATFNFTEENRTGNLLLGLLLAMCTRIPGETRTPTDAPSPIRSVEPTSAKLL